MQPTKTNTSNYQHMARVSSSLGLRTPQPAPAVSSAPHGAAGAPWRSPPAPSPEEKKRRRSRWKRIRPSNMEPDPWDFGGRPGPGPASNMKMAQTTPPTPERRTVPGWWEGNALNTLPQAGIRANLSEALLKETIGLTTCAGSESANETCNTLEKCLRTPTLQRGISGRPTRDDSSWISAVCPALACHGSSLKPSPDRVAWTS